MSEVTDSTGTGLDGLRVGIRIDDGKHVVEALVVCKIYRLGGRGEPSLGVFPSKDLDWIDKYGLLAAARRRSARISSPARRVSRRVGRTRVAVAGIGYRYRNRTDSTGDAMACVSHALAFGLGYVLGRPGWPEDGPGPCSWAGG